MAKVNGDSDLLPCSLLFSTLQLHSTTEQEMEERKCNYERYRGLVQNDFASSKSHTITRCLSPSFPYKRSFDGKMLHKQVKKKYIILSPSLWGAVFVPDLPGRALRWPAEAKRGGEEKVCLSKNGNRYYDLLLLPLASKLLSQILALVLQTGRKKGCHRIHLWRQHRGRAGTSVWQRWRQLREQWIWGGRGHSRYWYGGGWAFISFTH